jgi:hypothetical protein
MPTRKQKRREAKSKRHEYEIVYVDDEGNEVEPPPEDERAPKSARETSKNGRPQRPQRPQRGQGKVPQPPSWQRAAKRAAVIGGFVFILFAIGVRSKGTSYLSAALLAVLYTGMFIPLTYAIDRFAYRRYQARLAAGGGPTPAKKR